MADPTNTPQADEQTTDPVLGDLVRVTFSGTASPSDGTGEIKLASGPNGEDRTLTLGGSPQDALVTVDELNMLAGKYAIEVHDEQPQLTPEEVAEQMPPAADFAGIAATLPNPNPDAEASPEEIDATPPALQPEEGEQSSAGDQSAPEAPQPASPSEQAPSAPAEPFQPQPAQPQTPEPTQPQSPSVAPDPSPPTTTP